MTRMQQVSEKAAVYGIWTGIVLILLTPFVVTPDTIFPFVVGKAVYSRSLIECVFGVWAILALFRPAYRPPRSRLLLLLALSVGVSILAACFGVSPQRSFWSTYERMQGVVDLIHWFAFAVVLASVLRTERDWRVILNINVGASLVMAVLAICLYYSDGNFLFPYDVDTRYANENTRFGVDGQRRVHGTLGNATSFGAYLSLNFLFAVGFFVRSIISIIPLSGDSLFREENHQKHPFLKSNEEHVLLRLWMQRCLWGTTLMLSLWALSLAGSRGAILGLIMGTGSVGCVFVFRKGIMRDRLVPVQYLGTVIFAVGLIGFVILTMTYTHGNRSNPFIKRTFWSGEAMEGLQERLNEWEIGSSGFIDKPLLGWGPENYLIVFGRYAQKDLHEGPPHDSPHGRFLGESVEKGVLGQITYLVLHVRAFFVIMTAIMTWNRRRMILPLSIGAGMVGNFVQSQFTIHDIIFSFQQSIFFGFAVFLEAEGKKLLTTERGKFLLRYRRICAIATTVSMLLVVGAGLLGNYFIYLAACNLKTATSRLNLPGQSTASVRRSIAQFEPLANSSRTFLFNNAPAFWKILRKQHKKEAERFLMLVQAEADKFFTHEPQNWRAYRDLAKIHIATLDYHPEHYHKMRFYSKRALELAPHCAIPLFLFHPGRDESPPLEFQDR